MNGSRAGVPMWLRAVTWVLAIGLAILGIVLAVVTGSFWPLLAFAGLALPMIPVGTSRTTRARARPRGPRAES
ncbi:hypothetical protein F6J84_02835 [Microbacterium caowuchunii]|uniref:hypothetical protein n=1 Tax=Microbacterium caowuchunii TaxID=2614638 RepID=UPI0012442BFD|nr:hypothetical protein [Microbacterium caowuchunii]QEV99156.1 hypothetical protein F6J84_02835 [Microbacterium caowuchunii]